MTYGTANLTRPIILVLDDNELSGKLVCDLANAHGIDAFASSKEAVIYDLILQRAADVAAVFSDGFHPHSDLLTKLLDINSICLPKMLRSCDATRMFLGIVDRYAPESSMIYYTPVSTKLEAEVLDEWIQADSRLRLVRKPARVFDIIDSIKSATERWENRKYASISPEVSMINIISDELALACARFPDFIDNISPRAFEEMVGAIFRNNGCAVELTSKTRDGGYDLVIVENSKVPDGIALVEVKHFKKERTVGVDLVRSLYGVRCLKSANKCYLVTSSSVSQYAKREFSRVVPRDLEFIEREDVISWCRKYYSRIFKESGQGFKNRS